MKVSKWDICWVLAILFNVCMIFIARPITSQLWFLFLAVSGALWFMWLLRKERKTRNE